MKSYKHKIKKKDSVDITYYYLIKQTEIKKITKTKTYTL